MENMWVMAAVWVGPASIATASNHTQGKTLASRYLHKAVDEWERSRATC